MEIGGVIIFALIIMVTYFIEGLIGFGGTVMALPLASAVMGIKVTVPVLTIVVLIASIIIAIRDRRHINKKELCKITCLMTLGLPIGMYLFKVLPERPLKCALGIFMVIVGLKGIYDLRYKKSDNKENESKAKNILNNIMIFLGGIVHGAFTCGGAFIVVYATKKIRDKSSFRATLCALWAILNGIMVVINISSGEINGDIIKLSVITMLFVTVSIVISNIVHKKINSNNFSKFVYIALTISGLMIVN